MVKRRKESFLVKELRTELAFESHAIFFSLFFIHCSFFLADKALLLYAEITEHALRERRGPPWKLLTQSSVCPIQLIILILYVATSEFFFLFFFI